MIQGKGAVMEETSGSASIDGIGVWVPAGLRPPRGAAGEIDWLLEGLLSRLILSERFSGKAGEVALLAAGRRFPAPWVLVAGVGNEPVSPGNADRALKAFFAACASLGWKTVALELPDESWGERIERRLKKEAGRGFRAEWFQGRGFLPQSRLA